MSSPKKRRNARRKKTAEKQVSSLSSRVAGLSGINKLLVESDITLSQLIFAIDKDQWAAILAKLEPNERVLIKKRLAQKEDREQKASK